MNNTKEIANIIKSQIAPMALICAGAKNYAYGDIELGALSFDIKGTSKFPHRKHKVIIILAWDDTYKIEIKDRKGNLKESAENVYCDQLTETLERLWETEETMKNFIPANKVKLVVNNITTNKENE